MAEEVKVSKFKILIGRLAKFFKDIRNELKKVIWPNRVQVTKNTITVLLACLLVGSIIWLADAGLGWLRLLVYKV